MKGQIPSFYEFAHPRMQGKPRASPRLLILLGIGKTEELRRYGT